MQQLSVYEQSLIPLAQQRSHAALAGYRGGTESLAAVLSARQAEIDIGVDRMQLELQTALLWSQLEFLFATPPSTISEGAALSESQP